MKDVLKLDINGIKCDVCDYKNNEVKVENYHEWLNKPCPKCGSNLLTQEDLDSTMMLLSFADAMNKILPKIEDNEPIVENVSIEMNGTGEINFVFKE